MTLLANTHALVETLGNIHTIEELKQMLDDASQEFDIDKIAVSSIPPESGRRLSDYVLYSNLSPDLLYEYDEHQMLQCSTHFEAIRHAMEPRIWRTDMVDEYVAAETEENMQRTRDFLYRNDISMGCSFPIAGKNGNQGVVMFMGDRGDLDPVSISYLSIIANYAFEFIYSECTEREVQRANVTKRERQILLMAADGLTSGAIAHQLCLSEHTVNAHFHSAMKKLKCVNRTQLIAKALRTNIIT